MADLVDMTKHSRANDTHKWVLTVIDTFSRFAFAVPVRTRSAYDVSIALERLLTESKRQPDAIVTDDGKEFFNNRCDELFQSRNIAHYSTSSVFKASTVERFNRTLKTHLYKHFTKTKNSAWQTILPQLINNYNRRVHRSIGMAPVDVNYRNQSQLYVVNKLQFHKTTPEKYKVGDQVRFATAKMPFAKGYTRTFTSEIFVIARVMKGIIATYQLKDSSGKWVVTGSRKVDDSGKIVKRRATKRLRFYAEELVPAV